MTTDRIPTFDLSAIGLSSLCLAHCLILPVLAATMPALSAWTETEWLHLAFAAAAVPISVTALYSAHQASPLHSGVVFLASSGLTALMIGATSPLSEQVETLVTVTGSLMLTIAHIWNWRRHHHPVAGGHH